MAAQLGDIFKSFVTEYRRQTPRRVQMIDYFALFALATGVAQFVYLLIVGQFPFNSFLAGFIASVGFFVFTVCLRLQVTNKSEFHGISDERAYADFVVCNILLFFVVVTFMG